MLDVLHKGFKNEFETAWQTKLKEMMPSFGRSLTEDAELCKSTRKYTSASLGL
jgi:malate dehydrogenase (quinone)